MSSDHRYLAFANPRSAEVFVSDLSNHRIIGRLNSEGLPWFVADDSLVIIPENLKEQELKWYRIENQELREISTSRQTDSMSGNFLCVNHSYLVTADLSMPEVPFWWHWDWIPQSFRITAGKLGLINFKLQISLLNLQTKLLERQLSLHLEPEIFISFGNHRCCLSRDAKLLAIGDGSEVTLWDLPPRRPPLAWLLSGTLGVFALFLAWPRRIKVTSLEQRLL